MATARRVVTVIDDHAPAAAFADDGGDTTTTAIEDLPADVLALVLRRLDGASLAALACASTSFRELASETDAWRGLCLARWPSLRDVAAVGKAGFRYRQLFADAFPFPAAAAPSSSTASPHHLPGRLVSAVDLHHGGACILSRVAETDAASSGWFLGAPFRVDALAQDERLSLPSSPIAPADQLALSWVLIDPSSVHRSWLTAETVVRFAVVLGDGGVALDAAVTLDERCARVREVSLCMEDGEGGGVSGRDGLAVVAAAMHGARQGPGGAEAAAESRYQEFIKRKTARKERKARREGIIDLCCSAVGAAAFLGFLVMLTFR